MVDSDDSVLDYTQTKRLEIVDKLTAGGIPVTDNDQMNTLLKTLDGMDRVALGKKRIKADEGLASANQAMAATVISELLRKANSGGVKPFVVENAVERPTPVLGNEVPPPVLVEGETDVLAPQMSYDTFMAKFEGGEGS